MVCIRSCVIEIGLSMNRAFLTPTPCPDSTIVVVNSSVRNQSSSSIIALSVCLPMIN